MAKSPHKSTFVKLSYKNTLHTVGTQRCFNVLLTPITFKKRWIDVQITSCVNSAVYSVYLFIFTQRSFTWNSHGRQISSDSPTAWSWQIRRKYSKSIIHWRMYTVTKLLYFPNNHWKKRRLKRDMFCNEHFIFIIFRSFSWKNVSLK